MPMLARAEVKENEVPAPWGQVQRAHKERILPCGALRIHSDGAILLSLSCSWGA